MCCTPYYRFSIKRSNASSKNQFFLLSPEHITKVNWTILAQHSKCIMKMKPHKKKQQRMSRVIVLTKHTLFGLITTQQLPCIRLIRVSSHFSPSHPPPTLCRVLSGPTAGVLRGRVGCLHTQSPPRAQGPGGPT